MGSEFASVSSELSLAAVCDALDKSMLPFLSSHLLAMHPSEKLNFCFLDCFEFLNKVHLLGGKVVKINLVLLHRISLLE